MAEPPLPNRAGVYLASAGRWQSLTEVEAAVNPAAKGAGSLFGTFGFGGMDWAAQLHADEALARVFPRQTDAPAVPAGTVTVLAVQDPNTGTACRRSKSPRPAPVPTAPMRRS